MFRVNRKNIILFIVGGLLLLSPSAQARQGKDRVVWTKTPNSHTGLYTTQNYFVSHGVSLNVSGLYFFGDVDNEGLAFHGGFNVNNLSLGGGLQFAYTLPAGNHCNMRFGLMGGTLRGNNQAKFEAIGRDDFRKFHSWFIQPAVGVEYYPFTRAGFFLYGGVALTASIIDNYEFYYNKRLDNGTKERTLLTGKTQGFLPMIQLGIGYSWALSESWVLSLEIMVQEGLTDTHYMNLDAMPLAAGQNSDGVEIGNKNPWTKWTDPEGNEHIHWNDGWFQVGLTISYRWRNCEYCRNSNNYGYMRPARRSR